MAFAVDETFIANLTKRLQKEWSAWNISVESTQLLEVLQRLRTCNVKTQLKFITAIISITDDDGLCSDPSVSLKVQEYLSSKEAISDEKWNLWVPNITECIIKRLLSSARNVEEIGAMDNSNLESSNSRLDKESREIAEILLSNSTSTSSIPTPDHDDLENLSHIDMVRKYFFHESVTTVKSAHSSSSPPSCCTYTREVEPDFLSREITAAEKRDFSRAATVESSGFSFK